MASNAGIMPIADRRASLAIDEAQHDAIHERAWGLTQRVDPSVTFEEYVYWAKIERADEWEANRLYKLDQGPRSLTTILKGRFSKGIHHDNEKKAKKAAQDLIAHGGLASNDTKLDEKGSPVRDAGSAEMAVSPEEWKQAARALKTASWGTIFFLITTDILGWSSTPFVFASVGYGPAAALYVIFGVFAFFSGWILWKVYLTLDSSRFPMQSYGDLFFRVYGPKMRHFINVTQAFQQFMTVCVLILGSGTTIAQLSNNSICFIACLVIFTGVGMLFGSIRSLQRVGWLANLSVWLNIASFIMIMVAASHHKPEYSVVTNSTLIKVIEPIKTFAGPPPDAYQQQSTGFAGQFNGVNQMVYSWGGALLFVAFMAEMRHPWDFWKGMLCAQLFIGIVYVFFGAFCYSFYGQYSASNIGNVIQPHHLQQVNNILGLITGAIACLLYFNIGMKTIYIEVFQEVFNFPEITTKKGRWLWFAIGPIYWALAFIIAAAVPNLNGISGIVAALLILNFTYTFPGLLYIGFRCQVDSVLEGEGFDPVTGVTVRHDGGLKRWTRGFMKQWYITGPTFLYFLGGLACCGMGSWAAIEGLISVFGPNGTVATSFGCSSPV